MSGTDQTAQEELENELLKKERYTAAFLKALPGFYRTLLEHGQWFTHHYTRKGLLFDRKEQFEAVPLLSFSRDECRYATGVHYITKDGKYLKNIGKPSAPAYAEIGAPELAEDIYLSLDWGNEHSSVSDDPDYDRALTELREAMDADDADGTVLRYCMLVLRYQYR